MRLALLQATGTPGDVAANTDAVRAAAEDAAGQGADLLITPEAFLTGYDIGPRLREMATAEPAAVAAIARQHGIAILVGWAEARGYRKSSSSRIARSSCRSTEPATISSSRRPWGR